MTAEQRPIIDRSRLRLVVGRYGKRRALFLFTRSHPSLYWWTASGFIDLLPRPSQLGVRFGFHFTPEDEDGLRYLSIGLLLTHLHISWEPRKDRVR